jgi:alpha-1,2-mannosyltransferase
MARRRLHLWILLPVLAYVAISTVYRAGPNERTDLPVYVAGANQLLEGIDPWGARSEARNWPYVYPSTFAVLVTPLTLLPPRLASLVWLLVSLAALAGGALALRRALGRRGPFRWVDDGVPLLLIALPAGSALMRGQVGPLLLGLLGLAAWCLVKRRDVEAGLLVALAAAIKLTPGLLLLGLLAARRWTAAAACCLGLILWLLLLPAPFLGLGGAWSSAAAFADRMVVAYAEDPEGFTPDREEYHVHLGTNQSLGSQVLRRAPEAARLPALLLLVAALVGASLALAASCLHRDARPGDVLIGVGLLACAPLLAAPVAWHHYHVLLLPLLVPLVADRRARPWVERGLLALGALGLVHFALPGWRGAGLLGLGTLLVFVGAARDQWRLQPATRSGRQARRDVGEVVAIAGDALAVAGALLLPLWTEAPQLALLLLFGLAASAWGRGLAGLRAA